MLNFIKTKKYNSLFFTTILIIAIFLYGVKLVAAADALPGGANIALGAVGGAVSMVLSLIAYILTAVIGLLITLAVALLVQVAQFGNIINVPTVIDGWVIVRDLCNMFFILILLVIAFATILRVETYQWKKILPKLLIMAVLINFSRTIFGLLVDFSQVIMLTFVNAFSSGGGWFIQAFRTDLLLSIKGDQTAGDWAVTQWSTAVTIIAGVLAALITLIIVSVMLAILVMRIVMLWIYTIFSPLIFLGFAVPAIQKYTSKIWEDFTKQLIVGPVLAFFIWLALTTASKSSDFLGGQSLTAGVKATEVCIGVGTFFCQGNFQQFIIVIGLLFGGLMMAQQLGGAAGSIAGKGMDWARKSPMLLGKGGLVAGGWAARKLKAHTGVELRPTKIISGIKEALVDKARREEIEGESKSAAALRKGGVGGLVKGLGASRDLTEAVAHGFLWRKGLNVFDKKSTLRKTVRAGGLRKDIKKMEEERDRIKTIDPKQAEDLQIKIDKANKELSATQTPYTYFADQKRNAAIREQVSKIGDNDNEEDLVAMFNAAVARGDKETAAAVYIAASKVGHANEIIMSQKATEDVIDDNGKVIIKKGEDLHQSGYGMNALTKQTLIGKLGMSEQEAFNIQSQVSTNAKSIGHFNLAESIGVKNGMLYQRKVTDQRRRSRGELRKVEIEKAVRNYNRLAYGDEVNQYDASGQLIDRKFQINELGKANILEWADNISREIGLKRFNKNAAMNLAQEENAKELREFVENLALDQRKFFDANIETTDTDGNKVKGGYRDYAEVVEEIIKYGEDVKKAADRARAAQDVADAAAKKEV